jgi:AcrR family transcriptional regulator
MAKTTPKSGRKSGLVESSATPVAAAAEPGSVTSRILAEATRLFAEKGFLGTSVQEIVDAANVTKGALYYYYSSKDDLLYEIYHRVIEKELATLDRVLTMNLPPADTVDALITDVMITTAAHRDDVTIFQREMHRLSPEKLKAVRSDRRRYHVAFRGVIEKGQRDGTFRDDISAELVVIGFFGLVHHYYTWYRDDPRFSPQYMARESSRWFLESLQPLPAAKRRPKSASNGQPAPAPRRRSVSKT